MTDLTFAYNAEELGWVSEIIELTGDIVVEAQLKDNARGRMVIKKGNSETGPFPKVLVSPYAQADSEGDPTFRITLSGEAEGKWVQFVTSEEPNYIRYANI